MRSADCFERPLSVCAHFTIYLRKHLGRVARDVLSTLFGSPRQWLNSLALTWSVYVAGESIESAGIVNSGELAIFAHLSHSLVDQPAMKKSSLVHMERLLPLFRRHSCLPLTNLCALMLLIPGIWYAGWTIFHVAAISKARGGILATFSAVDPLWETICSYKSLVVKTRQKSDELMFFVHLKKFECFRCCLRLTRHFYVLLFQCSE